MSKPTKRTGEDFKQMSLLELLQAGQDELANKRPGRLCVSSKLMASVKKVLKAAPKSRDTLADEMSGLVGTEITVNMVNSWCSDAHPHRLPAEFLPALCIAAGSTEPLQILNESVGIFTVAGPDALRAEVQKEIEAKRKIEKQIREKEALIKALEGKRQV